jgi:hypothetical protein
MLETMTKIRTTFHHLEEEDADAHASKEDSGYLSGHGLPTHSDWFIEFTALLLEVSGRLAKK